nr:helix-turn-helix domain-containing protein [Actinomycetota bacterium]
AVLPPKTASRASETPIRLPPSKAAVPMVIAATTRAIAPNLNTGLVNVVRTTPAIPPEAVAAARLHQSPEAERPGQPPQPGAGGDHHRVEVVDTALRSGHGLGAQPVLGPLAGLREHDERTGTAYLQTLAAWLDHPGEPGMDARALHVHPNTVRYRMQRMAELVELALADPEVRLALQLQLRALGMPSPG